MRSYELGVMSIDKNKLRSIRLFFAGHLNQLAVKKQII
jgi:hypothetical protein